MVRYPIRTQTVLGDWGQSFDYLEMFYVYLDLDYLKLLFWVHINDFVKCAYYVVNFILPSLKVYFHLNYMYTSDHVVINVTNILLVWS